MTLLILLLCALFEAGGDALMRKGSVAPTTAARVGFFIAGAVILAFYGWLVNKPAWHFSSLLGVYVVCFFVVAQVLAVVVFGDKLTPAIYAGGALIVAGGVVITVGGR